MPRTKLDKYSITTAVRSAELGGGQDLTLLDLDSARTVLQLVIMSTI